MFLRRDGCCSSVVNVDDEQIGIFPSYVNPSRPNPGRREKIKLSFYFRTSLWYLKRFYKGLKGLYKTFWGTTKKCKNKNLTLF